MLIKKSNFTKTVVHVVCEEKGSVQFEFPFIAGFDFNNVDDASSSCGCSKPLIYRDKVSGKYDNTQDGTAPLGDAEFQVVQKTITIFYRDASGIPTTPKYVKNENGVDVLNFAQRDHELLTLDIKIVKKK